MSVRLEYRIVRFRFERRLEYGNQYDQAQSMDFGVQSVRYDLCMLCARCPRKDHQFI